MKLSQKTRYLLSGLLAITFSLTAYAQDINVSGTVFDETGEPLIGATVMQKGSSNGVSTDIDGNYSIKVPAKGSLTFSYIGYDQQTVAVQGRNKIDVTMASASTVLDEVVAIGYGTVKKKDLTGAVSSVSGKDLAKVPVTSAAAALQGKAAGLNIVSTNGAPGASLNVTVRGGASLTQGTEPLYIVDGFAMSDALTNIDINDIETIDVLKDASSTAIYGARGSNGIIVITTKSAAKGKTKVDYNAFFSWDKLGKKLDMVSSALDYARYQYEFDQMQGKPDHFVNFFEEGIDTEDPDYFTGAWNRITQRYSNDYAIDWQDEAFGGNAFTQNHNVSISTGNEKVQALVSYNHNDQDGLLANHDYQRNSIRAKLNAQLFPHIKMDFSTFFYQNTVHGGGKYSGMKNVLLQPINGGTRFTRDELLNTHTSITYYNADNFYDISNPLIDNTAAFTEKRSRRLEVNGGITIDFLKDFVWRTAVNYTTAWGKGKSFAGEESLSYLKDPENTGMNGSIDNSESYNWHVTNTLTWNHTFNKKHDLNIMLGQEYSYSENEKNAIKLKKFARPNHGLDDISKGEVFEKSSGHGHGKMLSFFARANYNFDDRYLLTATMRADGSSKFGKGHKWGYFPSASAAWRISQEKFWLENNIANIINNLKLRVGYGVTGNNSIDSNQYVQLVSQTTYPMNNDELTPAFILGTNLANPDLRWETLHATNIGLDLGMFNNRINLTLEWYNNQISDMLMSCVIPSTTGYSKQLQNIGKMRNRGWEISLNTVNIHTHGFMWTSTLNLSFNRNKVIKLEGEQQQKTFNAGGNRSGTVTYYAVVGQSVGDMYGYKYDGIYTTDDFVQGADGKLTLKEGVVKPADENFVPQPGDIKFAADNEDGTLFTRKLQKIGNGTPDCIGGFNNTFSWKGIDLTVFMKFAWGNDIYNATKHSMAPYAPFENVTSEVYNSFYRVVDPLTGKQATTLDRLRELNPNEAGRTWSLSTNNTGTITYPSSYYVEDGSYLRLAQVTLGYTLPQKWTQKFYVNSLRIYFTANNLATITGYSGYNPDVSSSNDNVVCTPGYDSSAYPLSRSYVLGVNLSF